MSYSYLGQGNLFVADFVEETIQSTAEWQALSDADCEGFEAELAAIFANFPTDQKPNETQTEDDLIWPILHALGWADFLRQQNLSSHGRDDVPDGILFPGSEAKAKANEYPQEWRRYALGAALVESKRWQRPLDRRSNQRGEENTPSTQMLRYLRRADDLENGALRWGILTNGKIWRLYYAGTRANTNNFFEINLAQILALPGHNDDLFSLDQEERYHWLKVFLLMFQREAFAPSGADSRSFHLRAIDEGRFYEERVAESLARLVFEEVFPLLVRSIALAAPEAKLAEVREGALILLYRLLFILYAEDRELLPIKDKAYDDYGLRDRVRRDIQARMDKKDTFSETASRYWGMISDLCRMIDVGDPSIGLPAYNGGLFNPERTLILENLRLPDTVMAEVIDKLSFEQTPEGRQYINYRSLTVQQLGSIYERLLEFDVVREGPLADLRKNIFARKGSGSYYTPDELVQLILEETIGPLIETHRLAFIARIEALTQEGVLPEKAIARLSPFDPAVKILDLKICDPAMGSGHFLVSLVDFLTVRILEASEAAASEVPDEWGDYVSPLGIRIDQIRNTIFANAEEKNWTIKDEQLDDHHIVQRMVLKRCIYGVDKNAMAVELAKVSLWLHTFTVGAPLSFLDHHLRTGDSLFGAWVASGKAKAERLGGSLFVHEPISRALRAASKMQIIEGLTDAEIAEAHRSADVFTEVQFMTAPLTALLGFIHALDWLELKEKEDKVAVQALFDGSFGNPVDILSGKIKIEAMAPEQTSFLEELPPQEVGLFDLPKVDRELLARFLSLFAKAKKLSEEENFFSWQVAFPGVWTDWEDKELKGGFDAVIGNPPWDRMKLQQVEWFAERKREIAMAPRAAERKQMIKALEEAEDPLAADYAEAQARAEAAMKRARKGGDFPLLSGGDTNLYSLFVERAMTLVKPEGVIGLLVPSGIASDKTAAPFFRGISTDGKLRALYDFENKSPGQEAYFPDINNQTKFSVLVVNRSPSALPASCSFFLQDVKELTDPERRLTLSAEDFARVNPNTGTAPIFRTRRDAELTRAIYSRLPVLVDRSSGEEVKAWPVKYVTMFHMTNDSHLFRTREDLEEKEGAYPIGGNRWQNKDGGWVPLYEGKMIWHHTHRAASIAINAENQHRPAYPIAHTVAELADPSFTPTPQFWILATDASEHLVPTFAFRDVTNPTDRRTMDACFLPYRYAGNTLAQLICTQRTASLTMLMANFNAIIFDYICRQKVQKNHLNWYIVEQLPVVPPEAFEQTRFGERTAGEIVREAVLELTYTAHDMAPFALDMGYVDAVGEVRPPFVWDEARRLKLKARLDALFFLLYGVTDRDDVRYIYSTFPIVERQEMAEHKRYLSRDLCLAYMNAFQAGNPDAEVEV